MVNKYYQLIVLSLFVLINLLFAQSGGKIVGIVTDAETGEPLAGANVVVEGTNLGAATDLDGTYVILQVPPGVYSVSVEYISYQKSTVKNVQVLTDLTSRVNFKLHESTIKGKEVVVVAKTPVIRKDLTSFESRVSTQQINRMPVQELNDVIDLQAGVVRDAGGGIHIRGGRSTEVSYLINGISITDNFTRSQALQVENESVQELQVISGTFNAEYGNAMSGIINVVTKVGSNKFSGNFEAWTGDYISGHDKIFWNINDVNPFANYNFQGALSGALIKNKMTFFLTARRWNNDGWLFGPNAFRPQGRTQVINGDTVRVKGDSSAVSMNFKQRWSGQASLEWHLGGALKLRSDFLGSTEKRRNYDHFFRLNPKGDRGDKENGITSITSLTHQLGSKSFQEITFGYKYNEIISKLFDNPFDSRYVHPDSLNTGAFQFAKAGTDLARFKRYTRSLIFKWDMTSQISKRHQTKIGIEYQRDRVFFENIVLVPKEDASGQQITPFQPEIRPISTSVHDLFSRKPVQFAAFVQDKIEYESLIINVGLRFDSFDANGLIPKDPQDPNIYNPFKLQHIYKDTDGDGVISTTEQTDENKFSLAEREKFWYKKTSVKTQLSPRVGIAYPISSKGVIHFSYGIFQQIPDYQQLYVGDQLKLTSAAGTQGPFGNPDLKPQRTTMYEIGLKQQLSDNFALDVTGFYRDIRDWISTSAPLPTALAGVSYATKINKDFANVKGVTLTFRRLFANHFSFNVDYTYQQAEGSNSTPEEQFFAETAGAEPTRRLTPLNWDQTHSLNMNLFFGSNKEGVSLIGRYNSGQPYTPQLVTGTRIGRNIIAGLEENSRRKPDKFTIDLTAFKNVAYNKFAFKLFFRVFNVLDAKNPVTVYGDSGSASFTLLESQAAQADATWFVRPDFYSQPRRFQIGMKINIK